MSRFRFRGSGSWFKLCEVQVYRASRSDDHRFNPQHPDAKLRPTAAGQKFATQTSVDMLLAMATPLPLRLLAQALRRELYNSINLFPEINYSATLAM